MLLINLIFEFCVVIVQAGCTPRAWLPSDLATSPLVCNLYVPVASSANNVKKWLKRKKLSHSPSGAGPEKYYPLTGSYRALYYD